MTKTIDLTCGKKTLVSDEDYDFLMQWKWRSYTSDNKFFYVYRRMSLKRDGKRGMLRMHRIITNCPPELQVDHINHDTLDNRRENLRNCTASQNQANQVKTRGFSQFKGVYFEKYKKRWRASICVNQKVIRSRRFRHEFDAAISYNRLALEHFGEFALLNIIPKYPTTVQ